MGHKYKKTDVKDVKIERINLKNKSNFLKKPIKTVAVMKRGMGNGTKDRRKETSKVAIRQYTLINKP